MNLPEMVTEWDKVFKYCDSSQYNRSVKCSYIQLMSAIEQTLLVSSLLPKHVVACKEIGLEVNVEKT